MHRRQIVRDAAIAQLSAIPTIEGRCFNSRGRVIPEEQLPALRVYTTGDAIDAESETLAPTLDDSSELDRIQLRVEALVKAADGAEDQLDALCEEIEQTINDDPTLGGVTNWTAYQSTEIELDDESDQKVMQASINFEVAHIQG